jgi:hypothetical protein
MQQFKRDVTTYGQGQSPQQGHLQGTFYTQVAFNLHHALCTTNNVAMFANQQKKSMNI